MQVSRTFPKPYRRDSSSLQSAWCWKEQDSSNGGNELDLVQIQGAEGHLKQRCSTYILLNILSSRNWQVWDCIVACLPLQSEACSAS